MIAFVRHGQTAVNRAGRLQGRVDAELDRRSAREQAARLADGFATVRRSARVVASPLRRARSRPRRRSRPRTASRSRPTIGSSSSTTANGTSAACATSRPTSGPRWRADPRSRRRAASRSSHVTARVVDFCAEHLGDDLVDRGEPRLADQGGGVLGARRRRARDLADVPRPRVGLAHRLPRRRPAVPRVSYNEAPARVTRRAQSAVTGIERRAGSDVRAARVDDEPAFARPVGDGHAERFEQRVVFLGGAPGRREVVADDQRVRAGEQSHRLQLAEHAFASAGEPQPRAGQDQAEQRDRLERFAWRQRVAGRRAAYPAAGRAG